MYVPGKNIAHNTLSQYWFVIDDKVSGPFFEHEIIQLIKDGKITKDSFSWKPNTTEWVQCQNNPTLLRLFTLYSPL